MNLFDDICSEMEKLRARPRVWDEAFRARIIGMLKAKDIRGVALAMDEYERAHEFLPQER
jgi:hypothetical protein